MAEKMDVKKLNILILGPDRRKAGGIATVIHNLYNGTLTDRFSFTYILTQVNHGWLNKMIQFLKAVGQFLESLLSKHVDLVHIHTASRTSFFRKSIFILLSKLFRKKVVLHIHGGAFYEFYEKECNRLQKKYIKRVVNMADTVILLSKQWTERLSSIVDSSRMFVLPNPVSLPDLTKVEQGGSQQIVILFMGNLCTLKGIYDLIDSAERLIQTHSHLSFVLGGVGETEKVKATIRRKRLEPYFELPGWIDQKDKYYQKADIFVLPSYVEALPMVILEAASYGLPLVATNVGAIPEIVKDCVSGYLVNPGSIDDLTNRLNVLILDASKRKSMGCMARSTVEKVFAKDKVISELQNLYLSLCQPV